MRKFLRGSLWLCGVLLLAAQAPQAGTKFLGSWKLTSIQPSSHQRTLDDTLEVGATQIAAQSTSDNGSGYRITFSPVNGQAVPVTGDSDMQTITLTRVDNNTMKVELGTSRRVPLVGQATLSPDGNTMTVALSGQAPMAQAQPAHFELIYTRQ